MNILNCKPENTTLFRIFVVISALLIFFSSFSQAFANWNKKIQIDLQGDARYSRYNFTDIKNPYNGFDAWTEIKSAYWLNDEKSLSPFISIIPTATSEEDFFWQRNVQAAIGLQFYPLNVENDYLKAVRLFAMYAIRGYYDKPSGLDLEEEDFQIGVDYYYENLFDDDTITALIWTNARFSTTNFSIVDYNTFLWSGNVKIGPKIKTKESIILTYLFADWTYVPKYNERWWENFGRVGLGARWHPWGSLPYKNDGGIFKDILRRINLYAEVVQNATWLGDSPPHAVEETDYRAGIAISTSGFLRLIE